MYRKEVMTLNVKKKIFKAVCVAMSSLMLASSVTAFAEKTDNIEISNPYANVNWAEVNQYKTALHTHTTASDGDQTVRQSLERHYESGFDVVAITDHGTTDYSWSDPDIGSKFIGKFMKLVNRTTFEMDYLGDSGKFADGMTYKMENRNGDDYLIMADGREMMRIPYGIENNAVSVNAHVNSWFAEFRNNSICDYKDAVKGADKAGAISVINHPGEYSKARYELYTKDAYSLDDPAYRYFFQKIYGLVDKYDSCIGVDVNSKGDDRTRNDRKFWDLMLTKAAESGKTVYGICTSDAHQVDKIDTGSTIILAEKKTSADIRSALENGEFFGYSTCINNGDELAQMSTALNELYGTGNALAKTVTELSEKYEAERTAKAQKMKKSNVGVKYSAIDNDGYFCKTTRPVITSVKVDDRENTITVNSKNTAIVRWISDGRLIATTKAGEGTIDLDDYEDVLGGYVRAEVFGEGGMLYTQGFTINASQKIEQKTHSINLGAFDFIIMDLNMYFGLLARGIKNLFA